MITSRKMYEYDLFSALASLLFVCNLVKVVDLVARAFLAIEEI